jgi:hypothetical protein
VTLGVLTDGGLTVGAVTFPPPLDGLVDTGGVETLGVTAGATVTVGVVTTGVLTDGAVTVGVVTVGVLVPGTLSAGAVAAAPIVATIVIAKTAAIRLPCDIRAGSYLDPRAAKPDLAVSGQVVYAAWWVGASWPCSAWRAPRQR